MSVTMYCKGYQQKEIILTCYFSDAKDAEAYRRAVCNLAHRNVWAMKTVAINLASFENYEERERR